MPGSIITCQGLSSTYNSRYAITNGYNNWGYNNTFQGLTIDAASDTFNVDTSVALPFPFQTGDVVYYGYSSSNLTNVTKYFAIRISNTSIKVASTYANALNGIAVDLTINSTNTNYNFYQHQISNVFSVLHHGFALPYNNAFELGMWQSSALSVISLNISQNFIYEFTFAFSDVMTGIRTLSGSYAIGIMYPYYGGYVMGRETTGTTQTNRFNAIIGSNITFRFTCANKIITFSQKQGSTFVNIYSTAPLTSITEPLQIFSYMGLNGTQISNCTLTYQ